MVAAERSEKSAAEGEIGEFCAVAGEEEEVCVVTESSAVAEEVEEFCAVAGEEGELCVVTDSSVAAEEVEEFCAVAGDESTETDVDVWGPIGDGGSGDGGSLGEVDVREGGAEMSGRSRWVVVGIEKDGVWTGETEA